MSPRFSEPQHRLHRDGIREGRNVLQDDADRRFPRNLGETARSELKITVTALAMVCLLCLAVVPLLNSQQASDSDAVAAITRLENEGIKADLANDTSFTKKNLADAYVAGTSFGDCLCGGA